MANRLKSTYVMIVKTPDYLHPIGITQEKPNIPKEKIRTHMNLARFGKTIS
jgi:hypothetical protein